MSDIGEVFKVMKSIGKEKKKSNLEFSTKKLVELGVCFESKNGGVHLIVKDGMGGVFDFYPSTGKYKKRGAGKWRRGLRGIVKEIGVVYE